MSFTPVGLPFDAESVWAAGTRTCYSNRVTRLVHCSGYPDSEGAIDGTLQLAKISGTGISVPSVDVSQGTGTLGMDACLLEEGTHKVWCWGIDYDMFPAPDTIADGIAVGGNLTAWLNGGVVSFVGNGQPAFSYEALEGLTGVTDISLGNDHGCYVQRGAAYCWGGNLSGELGDGTTMPSSVPVEVLEPVE